MIATTIAYTCLLVIADESQFRLADVTKAPAVTADVALQRIKKIDKKAIAINEIGTPIFKGDKAILEAFQSLQDSRPLAAIPELLPYVGVRFHVLVGDALPRHRVERSADNVLKAIGLPAIDAILKAVSEGQIDKTRLESSREILVDLLGEEGLRARVSFLKLEKNERVQNLVQRKFK